MIILIGPSASGKTEIAKKLVSLFNFKKFVTSTTRSKRVNEVDGVDYYFLTKDAFENKIKENAFIEYTIYNDNYYGSLKSEIGDNKVLIIEPNGLKAFNEFKSKTDKSFFIKCDEKIREKRMLSRGDNPIDIKKRLLNDKNLFNDNLDVDYVIENDGNSTLEELAKKIYQLYIKDFTEVKQDTSLK